MGSVKCPTCEASVDWSAASPYRPFCSKRCQIMDLGAWATERFRVPGDALEAGDGEDEQVDVPVSDESKQRAD